MALLMALDPPRATGQPTACALMLNSRPNDPVAGWLSGSIEWPAIPVKTARASSSRNMVRATQVAGARKASE